MHYFGETNKSSISPKVRRVQQAFDRAGVKYATPEDRLRIMWWKLMPEAGINQAVCSTSFASSNPNRIKYALLFVESSKGTLVIERGPLVFFIHTG